MPKWLPKVIASFRNLAARPLVRSITIITIYNMHMVLLEMEGLVKNIGNVE